MDVNGSPEYVLTWKHWDMASGPPICALRARAPRTSDRDCSGWPTPNAIPEGRGGLQTNPEKALERRQQDHMLNLDDAACLAGWATPAHRDYRHPNAKPWSERGGGKKGEQLPNQVAHSGPTSTSSPALTEKRGALSPEHSRWLMGFPPGWASYAPMVMPSSRKSRPNS